MNKRMRISSDGTAAGTRVLVDGELLTEVQHVQWDCSLRGRATVTLIIRNVPLEYEGAVEFVPDTPEVTP